MSPSFQPIDHYIQSFEPVVQEKLHELITCILDVVPNAEPLMNYGIPAFALLQGGKREEQIMIAGYAKHVGLYPHPTTIEQFKEQLKPFKHAKGSVQFPLNEPLPLELIKQMITYRYQLLQSSSATVKE